MRYAARRTLILLVTLWAAITLNFLLPRLMPGNPTNAALQKFSGVGGVDPAQRKAIEITLGVPHGSLWTQYTQYLENVVRGHFGVSYVYFPQSVSSVIGQALPWTLVLVGVVTVLSFVLGTLLGVAAAWRRGKALDTIATVSSTFSSAFPYFWTALLLLFAFGFELGWFPIQGGYGRSSSPNWSAGFVADAIHHSILPAVTILISGLGGWVLGMRNNMINTLGEDYVTFAQANGLPERRIALRYAARNAILPNLTVFGLSLGLVVSGSILTEVVYGYPGIGHLLYTSVVNQDYPLMQALFLVITLSVLAANFIVDLLYGWLDPRARR
jgi:peptide/nickel transport system permease protein